MITIKTDNYFFLSKYQGFLNQKLIRCIKITFKKNYFSLFHVRRSLPGGIGIKSGGIFLVDDDEDAFLFVGRIQRQNHHQHEVRPNAADQHWSEIWI